MTQENYSDAPEDAENFEELTAHLSPAQQEQIEQIAIGTAMEIKNADLALWPYVRARVNDIVHNFSHNENKRLETLLKDVGSGSTSDYYWGVCPTCGKCDGYLNTGNREHWFYCSQHKFKWSPGSNLFSSPPDETAQTRADNAARLAEYSEISPEDAGAHG